MKGLDNNHHPAAPRRMTDLSALCLEFSPSAMAMVDGESHLVSYVNPAYCRLMKKTSEQLVGKPLFAMLPGKDAGAAMIDRVLRLGHPTSHTHQGPTNGDAGSWSYTMWPTQALTARDSAVVVRIEDAGREHAVAQAMNEALIVGSVRQHELIAAAASANEKLNIEIVERKLAEAALQRMQAKLSDHAEELQELVEERTTELTATNHQLEAFAYSIAHDLRAPLRAMQGFSDLLVEEAGPALNDRAKGYAARISKAAQFMDALLCDLLTFSRISQGSVAMASTDLGTVVDSVLLHLQKDIENGAAQIEAHGPWGAVLAHEPTLFQVLLNLTSNALKFSRPGLPARIRLWTEQKPGRKRIWVEDDGVGIPPEYQKEIFRLFSRLNGEKYPGTGVGLSIVQRGIERMAGQLGVESTPGTGTRFWIELPQA